VPLCDCGKRDLRTTSELAMLVAPDSLVANLLLDELQSYLKISVRAEG
jgi:hypothetical protein